MVRFEKFLQFWNGHDLASRVLASDTRLRSRRVWRSLHATPLIVFLFLYHIRVLDQLVLLSITPSFMKIFRSRLSRACTGTVANVPQNYNSLGWWVGGKMGVRKKNFRKKKFFSRNFSASFSTSYRRHLGSKTTAQTRRFYLIPFSSYGGPKIFAKKILTPVSENLVVRFR
jgi:hypothetical protein